ncbi:uncharacterized protein CLUP02_11863 [Colletotrichum lupini]|uniref:Uncharacterized protein n=1 Tax=Colletotrichum lupini TaxID=145971 RepID=A0A9Q8WJW5_9PEZI|nr:uncharacterized protein CLUP02_11863 [Colletotrichum lupini]UQC86363.1 hypothetical protein CLUP02_11863 [Colletotrichum lupini]
MHLTTPFTAVLGLLIAAGAASPIQKDKVSIPADVSDDHSSAMTVPIKLTNSTTGPLIIAVTWNSCIKDCMAPKLSKYQGRVEDREWQ